MDFSLTDEQSLLLESIDEFCDLYFTEDAVRKMYEMHSMPDEIVRAYRDAGFGLLGIPEEYGGIPTDNLTIGLILERLYHRAGCVNILYQNHLSMFNIMRFGTEEQKARCMEHYMETGWPIASLSISEPVTGSDNRAMKCTARRQPDGTYLLRGQKTWVTMGGALPYTIVIAKDEDPARENEAMSLWLVDMQSAGVSTSALRKIGQQVIPFYEVFFDDVVLTEDMRMGEPGEGFHMLMKNFEVERLYCVAVVLGLAQAALEDAAEYATKRVAFGEPIANRQMIQEKLTEMETLVQSTRFMMYHTFWMLDHGMDVRLESAMCKRHGCLACSQVADMALSVYGALGYTDEVRVGRIWSDIRGNQFAGGTPEIMAYIVGRQVAKKYSR